MAAPGGAAIHVGFNTQRKRTDHSGRAMPADASGLNILLIDTRAKPPDSIRRAKQATIRAVLLACQISTIPQTCNCPRGLPAKDRTPEGVRFICWIQYAER